MTDKVCKKCNATKPLDEFYPNPSCKDGHYNWCKDCHKEYNKEKYRKRRARNV